MATGLELTAEDADRVDAKHANRDGIDAGLNGHGFHNPINPWRRDVWRAWNNGYVEGQQKRTAS